MAKLPKYICLRVVPDGLKGYIELVEPEEVAEDVRPVVRSHWKKNDNGTYSCERCHSWIPEEQRHYANWCLYCGADMREEATP